MEHLKWAMKRPFQVSELEDPFPADVFNVTSVECMRANVLLSEDKKQKIENNDHIEFLELYNRIDDTSFQSRDPLIEKFFPLLLGRLDPKGTLDMIKLYSHRCETYFREDDTFETHYPDQLENYGRILYCMRAFSREETPNLEVYELRLELVTLASVLQVAQVDTQRELLTDAIDVPLDARVRASERWGDIFEQEQGLENRLLRMGERLSKFNAAYPRSYFEKQTDAILQIMANPKSKSLF